MAHFQLGSFLIGLVSNWAQYKGGGSYGDVTTISPTICSGTNVFCCTRHAPWGGVSYGNRSYKFTNYTFRRTDNLEVVDNILPEVCNSMFALGIQVDVESIVGDIIVKSPYRCCGVAFLQPESRS